MAIAMVDGVQVAYDLIGDLSREGHPWVITPGGRFSKDYEGVRELAQAIAAEGNHVLVWDRPNCGESDVCFTGTSESAMQADVLAGLLRGLDLAPAVIIGGSGGSRVSLLTAARHPDVAAGLAMWWISGGDVRADEPRRALLLGVAGRRLERRHGRRPRASPNGSRCSSETPATGGVSWIRTRRSSSRRWSAGWPPTARAARNSSRACPTPTRAASPCRRWCFAAARATSTTPAPRRNRWPRCCPTPNWSSRRGVIASGSNAATGARSRRRQPLLPLAAARPHAHGVGRQGVGLALNPR